MNPYEPCAPQESDHVRPSFSTEVALVTFSTLLLIFNPLVSTVIARRSESLEMAGLAFLAILAVTLPSASNKMLRISLTPFLIYLLSLPWLGFAILMLFIRAQFGYLTALGEVLRLDQGWFWNLLRFSFFQCLIVATFTLAGTAIVLLTAKSSR